MPLMISSPNILMHFSTEGTSMGDFIEAGDELIVERLFRHEYKPGDILVFMHPELEKPVAHRLRWILKNNNNEWLYCMSGDSHPLLYEWIHEDFIRGLVNVILKPNGDKLMGETLLENYRKNFWSSFAPEWIKHHTKLFGIKILEILQSFSLYRWILSSFIQKSLFFTRYEKPDHLAIEVKVNETYAGRGHLVFSHDSQYEIVNLEVRARYKGMGIGKKLLHFLIEEAKKRNAKCIHLSVWNQSKPALHLYQKAGFKLVGEEMVQSVCWLSPRIMYKMELNLNS